MNEEIMRYVREERTRGTSEGNIRIALIARGWDYTVVEQAIIMSRSSAVGSIFNRTFFRFAFGFITILACAIALILIVGTMSDSKGGKPCIYHCDK